jgi:transcription antitermination factor NusG
MTEQNQTAETQEFQDDFTFKYEIGEAVKLINGDGDVEEGHVIEADQEEGVITVQFPCSGGLTKTFRSMQNGAWKQDAE